jgi:tRNA pseudouridine38-40 synthase
MRYVIQLAYDGARYHGWQVQPGLITVQGVIQDLLSDFLNSPIDVTGCGRTDAGVHASMFFAHFDTEEELTIKFIPRANFYLPPDIRVQHIFNAGGDFNVRFDALSRSYEYSVHFTPDPFRSRYSLWLHHQPDFDRMNAAAEKLLDYTTFTSFSRTGGDNKTDICKVTEAVWRQHSPNIWKFHITADRFLRGMVRAIVGTLLDLGTGRITENDFITIIEAADRTKAGESAEAHGLFLCDVRYPKEKILVPLTYKKHRKI